MNIDHLTGNDWITAKLDRATAAHDTAPESEEHETPWCGACWAEEHADWIDAMLARDGSPHPNGGER